MWFSPTRPGFESRHGKFFETRRRWNRTTGTLIPHGFEVQALNPQSSSTQKSAVTVDRTRDLQIFSLTLSQLSYHSLQKKNSRSETRTHNLPVNSRARYRLRHPGLMCCPYGPMDKAPAYGAGDSGFESQYGLFVFVYALFVFGSEVVQWLVFLPVTQETRVRFPALEYFSVWSHSSVGRALV
jgi:hypothetical protein